MKSRFEGEDGRKRLEEAIGAQQIVEHRAELAAAFAARGRLVELVAGAPLMEQGQADNSVYLILSGDVDVFVNSRHVATRTAKQSIGEMSVIDPAAPRSATVKARTPVCALHVSERDFREILDAHPAAWRAVAAVIAERLRQRAAFHRPPNPQPILFLGCSVEALPIAEAIQLGLKHAPIEVRIWTNSVFGPSSVSIDALLEQVDACDFAAFVFHPDDQVKSRGKEVDAPRDNTVFELGLFMGRLDRARSFIVMDHHDDLKMPSDLLGLTPLTFVMPKSGNLSSAIATVCTELKTVIGRLGVR